MLEKLDPSGAPEWKSLGDREHDYYMAAIRGVLSERLLVKEAIEGGS